LDFLEKLIKIDPNYTTEKFEKDEATMQVDYQNTLED
jgi:hypothetical protein